MKSSRELLRSVLVVVVACVAAWGQTTGSITGTVKDQSGAAIAGATVVISSPERGINRQMVTNSTGEYNESALPSGSYNVIVTANGFKKYQAKGVVLDVAQKARVDVSLEIGAATIEVMVEGANVAQVETQSSELAGTITGKELTQLQLNGRNFTSLVTLVPGVSNQTGTDEPSVGINGSVAFSMNGGRTEYNNWELDGGDNMDNGSNGTLNVYPSLDAIEEFKVLTSNYGAQYGRNGSGTVEVETKSGTKAFHGDAYEFVRNDMFNAQNYFNSVVAGNTGVTPPYKKNDYGYTFGGPIYIPGVYNKDRQKTFFFWSQEWRRDRVPAGFNAQVPYSKERTGDFSDVCPNPQSNSMIDCPIDPRTGLYYSPTSALGPLPVTPTGAALLALIPVGTSDIPGAAIYNSNALLPTNWREELARVDHNITDHNRLTFRYIHDSWNTLESGPIWDSASFPTVQTFFNGPGVSFVARLTSTVSPTLLNEFVASYTTDHIAFKSEGAWQLPAGFNMGYIYPNGAAGKLPAINVSGGAAYGGGFAEDPDGIWPEGPYNSNPTYTYRDNVTKIIGRHNLQFGGYFVAAQKNELSSVQVNGSLTYDIGSPVSTGNAFADLLLGNIASFSQGSNQLKFYNRYKIFEPYFQDDWRVSDRLTLNLGLRVSLEGTYRDRYQHAYNWDPAVYAANIATAPAVDGDGSITGSAGALIPGAGNPFVGLVQCGGPGGPTTFAGFPNASVGGVSAVGCSKGHLFNPAPRIGFAWDPRGKGKLAIRGGYGIFFEHANGNEANTEGMEGQSSPLLQSSSQINIVGTGPNGGYTNIGNPANATPPVFPLGFISIPNQAVWPYMQQFHLDIQQELSGHSVLTVSYVGSKGTHLGRQSDLNQLYPTPAAKNPYQAHQPISAADCNSLQNVGLSNVSGVVNGQLVTGATAANLQTACGNDADPYRPFLGISTITHLEPAASSNYNALQVSLRKSVGALSVSAAYTYSHSIDDSSDRYDGTFVNTYAPASNRASSTFDERHMLNLGYVYDLPSFKKSHLSQAVLGGWTYSGIATFATGTPATVTNGTTYGDNAGVGNGVGTGSYPDLVGNPKSGIPPTSELAGGSYVKFALNPGAFALPTGLTFGDSGRDDINNPGRVNFDMSIFKHFAVRENMSFEFRGEAFNIFNHPEWSGFSTGMTCPNPGSAATNSAGDPSCLGPGGANMFEINSAHLGRILQLGLKFIF
ncbi:MAG: carboxypeptidase regulatory-like domain-containing protein [Candidatus Sulfotelmatobacter sp.]